MIKEGQHFKTWYIYSIIMFDCFFLFFQYKRAVNFLYLFIFIEIWFFFINTQKKIVKSLMLFFSYIFTIINKRSIFYFIFEIYICLLLWLYLYRILNYFSWMHIYICIEIDFFTIVFLLLKAFLSMFFIIF